MLIALLGEPYLRGYRGIYRKFPCVPRDNKALELWTECLSLTQGFPIEYDSEIYLRLYELSSLLHREKILADLVLINKSIDFNFIKTKLLGYDITNNTMHYSVLGEKSFFNKSICKKWGVNENKLLSSSTTANLIVEYMNQHIEDFENEGDFHTISIHTHIGDDSMCS